MATVVLQYAGAALGTLIGGPIGGMIGRAIGGIAGSVIDHEIFSTPTHREGPRLNSLQVMASQEGSPIPVVYGRMRIAGQVIWATNLLEVASTASAGGGKGMGASNTMTDYSYFANFAVGLCEGEILGLGRAWADGKEIDLGDFSPRLYLGTQVQTPDSLIGAIEGAANAPAYRGLAYVVFERMPLAKFGNRLPQLAFEVIAKGNEVADLVKAVNIIPGATEFGYDTALVTRSAGPGQTQSENAHVSASRSDWSVSLDQLQQSCKNAGMASLVVSWFGNDLRCGQCQLQPGVESASKATSATWQVSGISRALTHVVSQVNGAPAYGGTPSDASVIHAIQDLKARGLKVVLNPFILMDVAQGNVLPDPYGGTSQAAYPWRGRITASMAPGVAGTPDKTAAAATQVSAFLGTATPSQFTGVGTTVSFSGTEWSYRRMVLHYAKLCALAGGVDAFLIGSELRGLTTLRSATSTYPFVAALVALAADVKAILPGAKISYAADWSEYFGHQPQDGSHDVYFHLDPLWSAANIDFIGIDNYFPLSDWRDGLSHLDKVSGARSVYDASYLSSRVAGGEGFDWFYASQSDRDSQTRTTITDGAYGKPWVFRPKDMKPWWLNAHYNRPGGVEVATPTTWVPQSKPIWFTELGCPAVDKGTNQPNLFIDAKSAESALPYYSGGQPDVQMQLAFVRAVQNYWAAAGTQNPASVNYSGTMVDATRLFHWCWDARPYPAFPARSDVWSDAANYARGHWLNGRIASVELQGLITMIAARFGFSAIDVSGVEGTCDGFVIDRPMSARGALEALLTAFAVDAVESQGILKFTSRRGALPYSLSTADLIDDDKSSPLIMQHRVQETDMPLAVHLAYAESGLDYRQAAVEQLRVGTSSKNEVSIAVPVALPQHQAQARADVMLAQSWAARESAEFALPPHLEMFEPGDVLQLGSNLWRVKTLKDGIIRKVEAEAHDPFVYDPPPAPDRGVNANLPTIYGAADVVVMDLALASADGSAGPRIAAEATPWPGALALYKRMSASSLSFSQLLTQEATIGTTLTALNAGLLARVDFTQTLDVQMRNGSFSSISRDGLLNGGNLIALGTAATGYELLQYQNATLIAPNTYRLSGLLRAQAGSGPEMLATRAAGADVVLLNAAVITPAMTLAEAGQGGTWRIGPSQWDTGKSAYINIASPTGLKALRPLAPTYVVMKKDPAGLLITWIRCTRVDGDSWELAEVPLGEASESYRLDIVKAGAVVRSISTSSPSYLYATADATADFGTMPANLVARVSQVSAATGAGAAIERILNA